MIVTKNLKSQLAKRPNVTHIGSVCGSQLSDVYYTRLYHFVSVDKIMNTSNGESLFYNRGKGTTAKKFYQENPNAVARRYSHLFIK